MPYSVVRGRLSALVALAVVVGSVSAARADDGDARQALTSAIVLFGQGELAGAKAQLDEAERKAAEPKLRAQIHRQRAIILEVEGQRPRAIVELLRGLSFNPALELSSREHKAEVVRLFECAKRLFKEGVKDTAVEARFGEALARSDWKCPDGVAAAPGPTAKAELVEPSPPPAQSRSILKSPVFWIITGAVVAAGGATAIVLATSGREAAYPGSTGVVVDLGGH